MGLILLLAAVNAIKLILKLILKLVHNEVDKIKPKLRAKFQALVKRGAFEKCRHAKLDWH